MNDIGHLTLCTASDLPLDDYTDSRATGSFILISPADGQTLAAGMVGTPLTGRESDVVSHR
ncbi:hypothetical protein [Streptomyces sp. NPDC093097]|uniref:elongation factor 1-alpha C-terminal domain-related protein n=1 Tax=Streptomyces sp. NPDC093097 TaxID=3366027 RepID=UPI0038124BBB